MSRRIPRPVRAMLVLAAVALAPGCDPGAVRDALSCDGAACAPVSEPAPPTEPVEGPAAEAFALPSVTVRAEPAEPPPFDHMEDGLEAVVTALRELAAASELASPEDVGGEDR